VENRKVRTKEDQLEAAIWHFEQSYRSTDDYMALFQTVHQVTRQGSGLVWKQVREIIGKTIN